MVAHWTDERFSTFFEKRFDDLICEIRNGGRNCVVISVWNRENFGFEEFMIGRKETFWGKFKERKFGNGVLRMERGWKHEVFKFSSLVSEL